MARSKEGKGWDSQSMIPWRANNANLTSSSTKVLTTSTRVRMDKFLDYVKNLSSSEFVRNKLHRIHERKNQTTL